MNHERVDRIALYITVCMPIFAIILIGYMIWPRNVLTIHSYEVYNDISPNHDRTQKSYEIKAGEELEFEIVFSKMMEVTCEVTLLLMQVDNGYLYPFDDLPQRVTRMPVVSNRHFQNSTIIPTATPQGKYVLIRSYSCPINFINTFKVYKKSNEFFVKGRIPNQLEMIKEVGKEAKSNSLKLDKIQREIKKK